MHKKLITACLALVAFAAMAVVPAFASASPVLTTSGGATVATGTTITATNSGNTKFTSNLGTVECSNAKLEGPLKVNSGTKIEGEITTASFTGTGTGGTCTSTWGINWTVTTKPPYCLVSTGGDVASIQNGVCGKTSGGPRYILETGSTVCEFERQTSGAGTAISSSYTTNTSPLTLETSAGQAFKLIRSEGIGCPSEGTLDATFVVKTSAGGELKIS